ncbi:hypothetical protein NE236_03965 [Actinoallomurus purpureus]|uniref:hypothetical protein n=1 Tax=Actinoallomurus purpureus TaxID=478114 RepID=UPI0020933BAF|nr:hypothetical protein [Actinoallomurus purpureus]MCO6004127.1 hypothetical protein [Actinoallomurus purpureus]
MTDARTACAPARHCNGFCCAPPKTASRPHSTPRPWNCPNYGNSSAPASAAATTPRLILRLGHADGTPATVRHPAADVTHDRP